MFCVSWWNVIRCSKLSTGHELAHCHLVGSRLIQEPVKYGLDEAAQQRVSDNGGSSRPYYWIMRRSIIRAAFVSARSHFSIGWKVSASPLRSSVTLLFSSSSFSSSFSFANTISSYASTSPYPFPLPFRHYFPLPAFFLSLEK